MIVIACRNMERDFVHPCVASCRAFMPEHAVCVVDSDSPNRSYMTDIDAVVLDVHNTHYEAGAWWAAVDAFPDERFYFLHDSMVLTGPLPEFEDLFVPGHLENYNGCDEPRIEIIKTWLGRTTYPSGIPEHFYGAFGNVFFASRRLMERMRSHGMDRLLPETKRESECMERIWGLAFHAEGFDVPKLSWGAAEKLGTENNQLPLFKYYGRRT